MFLYGEQIDKRITWPLGRAEQLARRGKLPHVVLPDGSIRFLWDSIEPLIRVVEPFVSNADSAGAIFGRPTGASPAGPRKGIAGASLDGADPSAELGSHMEPEAGLFCTANGAPSHLASDDPSVHTQEATTCQ